jgi:hypothetical protein
VGHLAVRPGRVLVTTGPLFWALKQTPKRSSDKLALIGICDQTNDASDWSALIAMEDLANFTRVTMRGLRDILGRLEDEGLLRSRDTRVTDQSGRQGWKRFYPLIPGCPVLKGQLGEINWDEPEEITSREMRNFMERTERASDHKHNVGRGARRKKPDPDQTSITDIPSSEGTRQILPGTDDATGTRNDSPGTYPEETSGGTRKEVPGTYPEGSSGPSYSPLRPLSPLSSVDPAAAPGAAEVDGEGGRDDLKPDEPADWAVQLINGLSFGSHRRPGRGAEIKSLARLVEAAVTEHGLSRREITQHCRAVINEASTSPVGYLRGGLHPDRLPAPQQPENGSRGTGTPDHTVQPASDEARRQAVAVVRQLPKSRKRA